MAVWVAPDSVEGKERARWETPKNQTIHGLHGMKNVGYEEYPKCLYRAGRPDKANVKVTGSLTVHTDQEEAVAIGQGWSLTQEDAIQRVHDQHVEFAKLAAERAFYEQRMSDAAQKEAAAYESGTVQHVPVIPEVPVKRKGGRPPKPKPDLA